MIPGQLYEAAEVEGASPWFTFKRLTLPLMAPILGLLALRDVIISFQINFVPALLVTEGGPRLATTYLPLYAYQQGISLLQTGLRRGDDADDVCRHRSCCSSYAAHFPSLATAHEKSKVVTERVAAHDPGALRRCSSSRRPRSSRCSRLQGRGRGGDPGGRVGSHHASGTEGHGRPCGTFFPLSRERGRSTGSRRDAREKWVSDSARSKSSLRRQLYLALKQLVFLSWASVPEVEDALGFDYRCLKDDEPHGAGRTVIEPRALWSYPKKPADYTRPGPAVESRAIPLERMAVETFTPLKSTRLRTVAWPDIGDGMTESERP